MTPLLGRIGRAIGRSTCKRSASAPQLADAGTAELFKNMKPSVLQVGHGEVSEVEKVMDHREGKVLTCSAGCCDEKKSVDSRIGVRRSSRGCRCSTTIRCGTHRVNRGRAGMRIDSLLARARRRWCPPRWKEGRLRANRAINRRVEVICLLVTMRALITCDCMKSQIASSDKRFCASSGRVSRGRAVDNFVSHRLS